MRSPLSKFAAAVVSKLPLKLGPPMKVVEPDLNPAIPPLPQPNAAMPAPALRALRLRPGIKPTELQQQFTDFIVRNDGVGIAAHTVGAGKTAASIMAHLRLRELSKAGKALVVVPAGLRENFAAQGVKKFTNARVGIIGIKQVIPSFFQSLYRVSKHAQCYIAITT